MIDDILKTPCAHGLDCADHDACCEKNPHDEERKHVHCAWCGHCRSCHPDKDGEAHDCYHLNDPCVNCGTFIRDRPKPTFGDHRDMCRPPAS